MSRGRHTSQKQPTHERDPVSVQARYYAETANKYREYHEVEDSAHDKALGALKSLLPALSPRSLLDVGTGTGRALRYFQSHLPDLSLAGVEPVRELVQEAERAGVPAGTIKVASGTSLPYADESVDVVTSFGVLHHVRDPSKVVAEMLRVAAKAVFISDSNRYGQGRKLARYAKLALSAAGLWPAFDWIRTAGRGYMESEGDGIYYSYSVFDSMAQLRAASSRLLILELERTAEPAGIWSSPIVNASTLLIGAYK